MIDEEYYPEEDYVPEDIAKLLFEKGFDWEVFERKYYPKDPFDPYDSEGIYAPTLQTAMKWLREVHNLCIEPYRTACGYLSTISKIPTGSTLYSQEYEGDDEDSGQFTTYEKSCEAAIKYCLEHLMH